MSKEQDLVPVHHATSPSEAEVVRTVLAGAGIRAIVFDRNTPFPGVDLAPFDNDTGVVGCEVMVSAPDKERATEVLREAREGGARTEDD